MSPTNPTNGPVNTDAPAAPTGGGPVPDPPAARHAPQDAPAAPTAAGAGDTAVDEPGGGADSVQGMHAMLMREHAEPRDGFEPVPFWVAAVCGGLLMWGGFYAGTNSADFRADVFDELNPVALPVLPPAPDPDPQTVDELKRIGEQKYQTVCAACHQPNGEGQRAQNYPPLKASDWVVGPTASPARLARVLLYGLNGPITVSGQTYGGAVMPAQGALKDYEIAAVLTYIRNNDAWGNRADPDNAKPAVTAAVVRAARAKEKDGRRAANGSDPVTAAELLKLAPDYADPPAPKK